MSFSQFSQSMGSCIPSNEGMLSRSKRLNGQPRFSTRCFSSMVGYGYDQLPSHILEHLGHVGDSFGSHALR